MSEAINILVATMSGTAEMVADALLDAIEDAGLEGDILRMEEVSVAQLAEGGLWLICSSTYGTGEVPDNGKPIYEALGSERPDLSTSRYGVIALGDSVYPKTFCNGGKLFDKMLSDLGATRIGDLLEVDARAKEYPDDLAVEWIEGWLELL